MHAINLPMHAIKPMQGQELPSAYAFASMYSFFPRIFKKEFLCQNIV